MAGPTRNPLSTAPADQTALVDPTTGKATTQFKQWLRGVKGVLQPGISASIPAGSTIVVVNGIVVGFTPP
jgi:hypothetical protein